jgi:hypothetical protein
MMENYIDKQAAFRLPKDFKTWQRLLSYKWHSLPTRLSPLQVRDKDFIARVKDAMKAPELKLGFRDMLKTRLGEYKASKTPFKDALHDIFVKGPGETLFKGVQNPFSMVSTGETAAGLHAAHPTLKPKDVAEIIRRTQLAQAMSGTAGLLGAAGLAGVHALTDD